MINKLRALWKNLLRKDQVEDDLDEELSEYLASLAEDKMRSGMNRDEAYVLRAMKWEASIRCVRVCATSAPESLSIG